MNDLGLDLVRTIGRATRPMAIEVVRDLRPEELALLALERGIKPKPIQKLRDGHHAVARLIAEGKKDVEINLITGLTASRISILKSDPSFMELISFYQDRVAEIRDRSCEDTFQKIAATGSMAMDEIQDRIQDEPEKIAFDELVNVAKFSADRTGFGPQTKSTNVNVTVDLAARVSAGRARADAQLSRLMDHSTPAQIEGEVESAHSPASPSPQSEGKDE